SWAPERWSAPGWPVEREAGLCLCAGRMVGREGGFALGSSAEEELFTTAAPCLSLHCHSPSQRQAATPLCTLSYGNHRSGRSPAAFRVVGVFPCDPRRQ